MPIKQMFVPKGHFNPRTPRGVRHAINLFWTVDTEFQSTHPARGATAPVEEANMDKPNFNPRTPRGVRPAL